jgi:hypothetical protein
MDKYDVLRNTSFGQRVAEDEVDALASYFVETDHWSRLYKGDIDIVYGTKGAGKSALYALLLSKSGELFDKNILLVAAENPRGDPAFRDLLPDPPATEREFVSLWKLYFASLLHDVLVQYGITGDATAQLGAALEREGLVKGKLSLAGVLRSALDYVRTVFRPPQALEGGLKFDPVTQMPNGVTGKIVFAEPGKEAADRGILSVNQLLGFANSARASCSRVPGTVIHCTSGSPKPGVVDSMGTTSSAFSRAPAGAATCMLG